MITEEVKKDLNEFKEHWRKLAEKIRKSVEWKTTKVHTINKIPKHTEIVSEVIESGDSSLLPTATSKLSNVKITVHYMSEDQGKFNQKALCLVLDNVCSGSSTKVNVNKILNTKAHLHYIDLRVNEDYDYLAKTLQKKSISVYVSLQIQKKMVIEKYFTIHLANRRGKRSYWSAYTPLHSIPNESLMPDYDQHICCGGCYSGCTPVAWAQVFAYYDRMAHLSGSYGYSKSIYQGPNGEAHYVAPGSLNDDVKQFIVRLRTPLKTYCDGTGGATESDNSLNLSPWFKKRQPNGKVVRLSSTNAVTKYVKQNYPVVNNIWWVGGGDKKDKSGHSVVVTKVKQRSRDYKSCRRVGWWLWRKTECEWKTEYDMWYRRMGWGRYKNAWYSASLTSAFVALR